MRRISPGNPRGAQGPWPAVAESRSGHLLAHPVIELRDHPRLSYRGMHSWPPLWTQRGTNGNKTLRGEVGILRQVNGDSRSNRRCFLVIEHEGERYVGTLLFDDHVFCWLVSKVLKTHIGWPIKDIGALDMSFTL
jgi:hypothetical protein